MSDEQLTWNQIYEWIMKKLVLLPVKVRIVTS